MTSPVTMKAAIASAYGQPDDVLTVSNDVPRPVPDSKRTLLIRVHAVSFSPGDYRGLLGDKPIVTPQPPYIPGGDVAGVVVQDESKSTASGATTSSTSTDEHDGFRPGDRVVATWDMFGTGGLAEYMYVNPNYTVKLPEALSFVEGAALANSSSHAWFVLQQANVQPTDRVLVLGGSGGVGTVLIQLLRKQGVGYVASTSTDEKLVKSIGADRVINYKTENWWQVKEFQEDPFDVLIDCAVGKEAWARCNPVLKGHKDGGRFIAVVLQDWYIDGTTWFKAIFGLVAPALSRQLMNVFRPKTDPSYYFYIEMANKKSLQKTVDMAFDNELKVIIDPKSPHPFTTEGVREAFNRHIAREGHGKIVVKID